MLIYGSLLDNQILYFEIYQQNQINITVVDQKMIGSKITKKEVNERFRIVHNFSDKKKIRQSISSEVPTDLFSCIPIHRNLNNENNIQVAFRNSKYEKQQYQTLYLGNRKQRNQQIDQNYLPYLKNKKTDKIISRVYKLEPDAMKEETNLIKQNSQNSKIIDQYKSLQASFIKQNNGQNQLKNRDQHHLFLSIKTLTPLQKKVQSPKNNQKLFQNMEKYCKDQDQKQFNKSKVNKKLFQIKTDTQQSNKQIFNESLYKSQNKIIIKRSNVSTSSQSTHQKRKSISIFQKDKKHSQMQTFESRYKDFCLFLQLANNYICSQQTNYNFKVFVGKGNNSSLVKSIFKNRYWINLCENQTECNIYWTQSRDQKFMETLDKFQRQKKQFQLKISCIYQFKITNQSSDKNIRSSSLKKYEHFSQQGFHKLCSNEQKTTNRNPNKFMFYPQKKLRQITEINKLKMHNHLQFNWNLSNKKALYYNLKSYYLAIKQNPFQYIPLTYHVQELNDQQWRRFQQKYNQRTEDINNINRKSDKNKQKNLWIIKPGENSNRGCGIQVSQSLNQIKQIVKTKTMRSNGKKRSHIIQKYLIPYLYNKRKFDIRSYILVTSMNGILKCYWYEEGYIRTASKSFTTKNIKNRTIHLTNDAIQKHSQQYGKYQTGNKLSFADFQKYLNNTTQNGLNFYEKIYPKMMKLAADAIKSTAMILDQNNRQFSFQIFGLDFMIDECFDTYLIQVNTNPCLQLSSPLLARIIPNMLQNAVKIAIDPLFCPPTENLKYKNLPCDNFWTNKFVLIFDSREQRQKLDKILIKANLDGVIESDEQNEVQEIDE